MADFNPIFTFIEIPIGIYEIGHEDIPNASPQHRRMVRSKVWLMDSPFTWLHFQEFVVGGGFKNRRDLNRGEPLTEEKVSVDQRVSQLLANSFGLQKDYPWTEFKDIDQPLTGMTWHEAILVGNFFEARLPSEIEWEIGTRLLLDCNRQRSAHTMPDPNQHWLEEWTSDAYIPRYWRADFSRTSQPWNSGNHGGVSVRGGIHDSVHKHVCNRAEADPSDVNPRRGFRLAWDAAPPNVNVGN